MTLYQPASAKVLYTIFELKKKKKRQKTDELDRVHKTTMRLGGLQNTTTLKGCDE